MVKAKLLGLIAVPFLLFSSLWLPTVSAQNVDDFKIQSFEADYYLDRTSDKTSPLKTTETIIAEFPDIDQNHGILRAIPSQYQKHTVSLEVNSVTDENGQPRNYTTYTQNDNLVLKIGDANRYVHGQQTYVIRYGF